MTTSYDGLIRLYRYDPNNGSPNFRRVDEPTRAPIGNRPHGVAFDPDNKRLAVGYNDVAAVDVLDATTLKRLGGQEPVDARPNPDGFDQVAWSRDGRTLFAAGAVHDAQGRRLLFGWDRGGLGTERRMTYCGPDTSLGLNTLPEGRILVASMAPCLGLMDARGEPIWTVASPVLDFRDQADVMRVSEDGKVIDFGYRGSSGAVLRFDARSLTLSSAQPNDGLTLAPNREGVAIEGWRNGRSPTLSGRPLSLYQYDIARSLAIAPDAKRFFLGSAYALAAFDETGTQKWRWASRNEVWAVNASRDGRLVVAADVDGAIRWRRADDGRELLALQVLPDQKKDPVKWDWVLWTPEGFYQATPSAQDVLKWVVNHGPDSPATTLPVSAIAKLHRPDALPLVLQELETARALGIADVAAARCDVQDATHSSKPPGQVLHVLAIGIDDFGKNAGGLHLNYAVDDASDVASVLLASQKHPPCKPSLYSDVLVQILTDKTDEKPTRENILKAMSTLARSMHSSGSEDVALVLLSTHGAMIDGEFYLVPYGVDLTSIGETAISVTDFAHSVLALAQVGKVVLLIDACHSGGIGADKLDASLLGKLATMDTVTELTSSRQSESSLENKDWGHGAFTKAFLASLTGAADAQGLISLSALADAMDAEVQTLTKGKQHLGRHQNFGGDLFVANH